MTIFCCVYATSMKSNQPPAASTSHTVTSAVDGDEAQVGTMYGSSRAEAAQHAHAVARRPPVPSEDLADVVDVALHEIGRCSARRPAARARR